MTRQFSTATRPVQTRAVLFSPSLTPWGCPVLKAADQTMVAAVASTLDALALEDADAGAKRLAMTYAESLDSVGSDQELAKVIGIVGPSLLKCLESLGATPKARAEIGKKVDGGGESQLAKLRAARR